MCCGVQVWWAQEEQWFAGTVSAYLPTSVEHKIEYDDGDVEIVQLWAPVQAIRLLNTKSQFAEAYELLCEKNKATAQAAAQHKEELLNVRATSLAFELLLINKTVHSKAECKSVTAKPHFSLPGGGAL